MTNTCCRCHAELHDGYQCTACTALLSRLLVQAGDVAADAEDTALGLDRITPTGTPPAPEPWSRADGALRPTPLPYRPGTSDRIHAAGNALTTWARWLLDTKPTVPAPLPGLGPVCAHGWACGHLTCTLIRRAPITHPASLAAWLLADGVRWMASKPHIREAGPELEAAARALIRAVDIPPTDPLVGRCDCGDWLYAGAKAVVVRCRNCGAQWNVQESRAILVAALRDKLMTASEAARIAVRLTEVPDTERLRKRINQWHSRGRLTAHGTAVVGRDDEEKPITVPTYRLGDILDRLDRQEAAA